MQRWMMITRQEWLCVIVYLSIRMTRGNGDTENRDLRDTLSLSAWIFRSRWSQLQVRVPLGIAWTQSRRIWLQCRVPGQVGGAGCLKYPNLYVFDEAIGRARCPVSIVIWTNIETKSKFISGKYVYLCIIPTVNMSLPLPLFYARNDFQSNELIWRITSHTIIDKCKKYWCICWQIFKYLDYFYSSPIISKFCGSVYDKQ